MQESALIITIQMDEFSHPEYIHVRSTQVKKWCTAEASHVIAQVQSLYFLPIQTASVRFAHGLTSFTQAMIVRYKLLYEFLHHLIIMPFIHLFRCWWTFVCLQSKAIMNSAARNINVYLLMNIY